MCLEGVHLQQQHAPLWTTCLVAACSQLSLMPGNITRHCMIQVTWMVIVSPSTEASLDMSLRPSRPHAAELLHASALCRPFAAGIPASKAMILGYAGKLATAMPWLRKGGTKRMIHTSHTFDQACSWCLV